MPRMPRNSYQNCDVYYVPVYNNAEEVRLKFLEEKLNNVEAELDDKMPIDAPEATELSENSYIYFQNDDGKINKVSSDKLDTKLSENITAKTDVGLVPEGTEFEAGTSVQTVVTQMLQGKDSPDRLTVFFWEGEIEPE